MEKHFDVIILGSGPAGCTAAVYTSRAQRSTLVVSGPQPGGQLTTTTTIENFPGFKELDGTELVERMMDQAIHCGAEKLEAQATKVDLRKTPFTIETSSGTYTCRSLIIATGSVARTFDLESFKRFFSKGISTCSVCDGALKIFRNAPVAILGGGDSAMEQALYMTKYASKVYIIHRSSNFRASKVMKKRVDECKKITIIENHVCVEALGNELVEGLTIKDVETGETKRLDLKGIFYAIGHVPNTELFKEQMELDKQGYIVCNETETSVKGVFAAGDVQDKVYMQAIKAAGDGCMAAMKADRFLAENN